MLNASDIMTTEVITAKKDTSLKELARILYNKHINGVPVVDDDGFLIGIICESDLIRKDKKLHIPTVVAINKVDIATDQVLTDMSEALQEYGAAQRLIFLSALKGKNVSELGALLKALLPAGPFFYPPDLITEQPERFFVAEIIREKILSLFRQEVPYSAAVLIEEYKEREPKNYIHATIYVERESQTTILVGTNGCMLKKVGQRARRDIERFIQHPIYLELWVKVREKWRKNERYLREFGYLE